MSNGTVDNNKLPIFQGIFATAILSWLGWLSLAHMETDRTQDVVLERLRKIEEDYSTMHRALAAVPEKTVDRWHRSEELIYQEGIEERIKRLELFHEPYMWEKSK